MTESYRRPPLYPLLEPIARLAALGFFRRLVARHVDRVPAEGPLILVGNHPNMLLDAFGVGLTCGRPVHFLAKSPLFVGVGGQLLRGCGVLPVYRQREGSTEGNSSTFDACFDLLARGGVIALFPEGTSHNERKLLEFKTGAARIALGAAARCGRPVQVQPFGLWYASKTRWWSDLLVTYGHPLTVEPGPAGEADRDAVRALTATAEQALRDLLIELDGDLAERRLALVEGLYRHLGDAADPTAPEQRYALARRALAGYAAWAERDPDRVADVVARLDAYGALLDRLGLEPSHAAWQPGRLTALAQLVGYLVVVLLTAPVALVGALANGLPFVFVRWLTFASDPGDEEIATSKLLIALVTYPLWWSALTAAAVWQLGPPGLIALPLLPLTGLLAKQCAIRVRRLITGVRLTLRAAFAPADQQALAQTQRALMADLRALESELEPGFDATRRVEA